MASLYERLGGEGAIDAAVDKFYDKIVKDDSLNGMFKNTKMDAQREKQKAFMTQAFGGPAKYTGKMMRIAHSQINDGKHPTEDHFGAVAGHLIGTLKELGVAQALIDEAIGVVATTKNDVCGL